MLTENILFLDNFELQFNSFSDQGSYNQQFLDPTNEYGIKIPDLLEMTLGQ